jgi:MFS family permease
MTQHTMMMETRVDKGVPADGAVSPYPETDWRFPGWRVLVAAVVGLAFSPGPMIFGTLGIFSPALMQTFGWNRGELMLGLTILNLASVLTSPATGRLLDKRGVRKVLFPSLGFFALGFFAVAWLMHSLVAFYVIAALWGALTVGTQSISYTKLISGWFVKHRGLAIGIAAAGLGAGYSIMPLIAARLVAAFGWQGGFATLGMLLLVPVACNAAFSRPNPAAVVRAAAETGMTLGEAARTRVFAMMALAILLASTALTGVVPHVALFALDRGMSPGQAAVVASVYGISTILGRVLVGALADRFPAPRVGAAFFALSALGFLLAGLLGDTAGFGLLAFLALVIGFGFGAESDIIALLIVRYFGQRSFGAIYGYLLSAFLIGASAGPPLFGFGYDYFGSYATPMSIATVVMVAAIALMLALPRTGGEAAVQDGLGRPSRA